MSIKHEKIVGVIDFGGQYAHLIAARIRRLGVYSEIVQPDSLTPESASSRFCGLVYSGGPSSVYEAGAPASDPELLKCKIPILGICYGHQLIMKQSGATVERSSSHEYGPATLSIISAEDIFSGENQGKQEQVWMSHGDHVTVLPSGFSVYGSTDDCEFAAVGDSARNIYSMQFHPEVTDSVRGDFYLKNFIRICGAENSWMLGDYLENEIADIQKEVGDKKVFFLISGGVDSTVAYALLSRALPREHLKGLLVDTGFMREGEIDEVRTALHKLGVDLKVYDAASEYYSRLSGVAEPEKKRNIIGELFVDIQERVSEELSLNPDEWYLGQGTIYPDRIESGATKHSDRIKTHHNRVERIERLLEEGRVVEPIGELYKDEVRNLGRLLGLPESIVGRHPFPGPGLAVRCLCLDNESVKETADTSRLQSEISNPKSEVFLQIQKNSLLPVVLPVRSVGVQGDKRSYAHPLLLVSEGDKWPDRSALLSIARMVPNRISGINRVLFFLGGRSTVLPERENFTPIAPAYLTPERMEVLRRADAVVMRFQNEKAIYNDIWQFPVVLAPLHLEGSQQSSESGSEPRSESIILRPICSTEAMTASVYPMSDEHLREITERLLEIPGVSAVFFDLTSKPPGTIEWE